jgi:hypothetical protein
MPVRVESPAGVQFYAFEPNDLLRLRIRRERFERSAAWLENAEVFREIAALARARDLRLLFVYVPSKPHVVLPLVRDAVPAGGLRAFLAYEEDDLPPGAELAEQVLGGLCDLEAAFLDFCREEALDCLSLAAPLRERMAEGEPVYFTYDPHWTRHGHAVAAEAVASWIRDDPAASELLSAGR